MPYQNEFINAVPAERNRLFHINKSRQIGVTELILRVLVYHCFHKYKGGKIIILAGTKEDVAEENMHRLKTMFQKIPWAIADDKNSLVLKLYNGTIIEVLSSNADSIRGYTKIKAIFVDEAAHFKINDDSVVLDAIEPIVHTNNTDLFLVSTPNGRRGFFYKIATSENEYFKISWDYTSAIGWIYTREKIETDLMSSSIDIEQEYRCQFTGTRDSIFGSEFETNPYTPVNYETW